MKIFEIIIFHKNVFPNGIVVDPSTTILAQKKKILTLLELFQYLFSQAIQYYRCLKIILKSLFSKFHLENLFLDEVCCDSFNLYRVFLTPNLKKNI